MWVLRTLTAKRRTVGLEKRWTTHVLAGAELSRYVFESSPPAEDALLIKLYLVSEQIWFSKRPRLLGLFPSAKQQTLNERN
jgi:hypothetical protein